MRYQTTIAMACVLALTGPPGAAADLLSDPLPEAPVLHGETERGSGTTVDGGSAPPPVARTVDGDRSDWLGTPSGFGGTVVHSAGELVYQDHLFDAYGPDDGGDAERERLLGPLQEGAPESYRLEAIFQADIPGEAGIDAPEALKGEERYGDLRHVDAADLLEVRVAADDETVWILARTTTMHPDDRTALLLLADTGAPGTHPVPFGSGLSTSQGDVAALLAPEDGRVVDLATGTETAIDVARNATGYENVLEAAIPRDLLEGPDGGLRLAAGSGLVDPGTGDLAPLVGRDGVEPPARLANVAFRTDEPVRVWFEKRQALSLHAGSIDPFFVDVDTAALEARVMETFVPGHGYHDRIFTSSTPGISAESGRDGIHQHYGVWVPRDHDRGPAPMTMWLHWRGGKAHSAAALTPRVFRDQGDGANRGPLENVAPGIVVAPRGRGTSTWYVGKGHADVLEVWEDAFSTFAIDPDRVYVSGHSMGGFGSYLLPVLYPDRFAGAFPVAGPVTQGAWTGLDLPGCDDLRYEEYTPCYVDTNDGDARTQHTRKLLDNLRHVPVAIFQGGADELVPTSGVTRQVERLVDLGYRHRYYLFPTYEHYSHPVADEWMEGVRYLRDFERPRDPARVTYVRDMPFERTVETGPDQSEPVAGLDFDFDSAYWMSGLTPVDPMDGRARIDARSLALPEARTAVPEAGGPLAPGQAGPYVMTGLAWTDLPLASPAAQNAFEADLDGASAVRLDTGRMRLDPTERIAGTITTEHALALELRGAWGATPAVTGAEAWSVEGSVLTVELPAGMSTITIDP